jgi:hypothetical protein
VPSLPSRGRFSAIAPAQDNGGDRLRNRYREKRQAAKKNFHREKLPRLEANAIAVTGQQ